MKLYTQRIYIPEKYGRKKSKLYDDKWDESVHEIVLRLNFSSIFNES